MRWIIVYPPFIAPLSLPTQWFWNEQKRKQENQTTRQRLFVQLVQKQLHESVIQINMFCCTFKRNIWKICMNLINLCLYYYCFVVIVHSNFTSYCWQSITKAIMIQFQNIPGPGHGSCTHALSKDELALYRPKCSPSLVWDLAIVIVRNDILLVGIPLFVGWCCL